MASLENYLEKKNETKLDEFENSQKKYPIRLIRCFPIAMMDRNINAF